MKDFKRITISIMVGLALFAQLTIPTSARADGEVTPLASDLPVETSTSEPTEAPTDVIATATPEEPSSTPAPGDLLTREPPETLSTDLVEPGASDPAVQDTPLPDTPAPTESTPDPALIAPVSTDTGPAEQAPADDATPTVEPAATNVPQDTEEPKAPTEEPVEAPATEVSEDPEQPTLSEVMNELPDDTSVVVLDENGEPVPLVAQDASTIIQQSDPVWCPAGQAPTPGANGCSASFTTLGSLVSSIGATINQNGTIWITAGIVPDAAAITIDGNVYSSWADYALTLQGGWSGTDGQIDAIGSSVFSVPITIRNWNNDLAVNLMDIQSGGLTLSDVSGSVNINYVNAPEIRISDSTIRNGGRISLSSVGADIVIDNVTVEGALGSGLGITTSGARKVSIIDSQFNGSRSNYGSSDAYPWGDGADIFTEAGHVTVTNSGFSGNDWGLWVVGANEVLLTKSTFDMSALPANNVDLSISCLMNSLALSFPQSTPISLSVDSNCMFKTTNSDLVTIIEIPQRRRLDTLEEASRTLAYHGRAEFWLDCIEQYNFKINLPNGDRVDIYCPVSGKATITRLDNTTLPAELPTGYIFASAFDVEVLQPALPLAKDLSSGDYMRRPIPVISEGGHIMASFVATPLQAGKTFSILYWDEVNSRWIPLKDFLSGRSFSLFPDDPADQRKILSGVLSKANTDPQRVQVSTNFPGIFVLAQH